MPLVLRVINRRRWDKSEAAPFLAKGDVPADPFGNLKTDENKLSVWLIDDSRANFRRVICAMAANRQKPDIFDYLLFDSQILSDLDITFVAAKGATPDEKINETFHYHLVELSGLKLLNLVKAIMADSSETGRLSAKEITELLIAGVDSKYFSLSKLVESLRRKIEPLITAISPPC